MFPTSNVPAPVSLRAMEEALVRAMEIAHPQLEVVPFPGRPEDWRFVHAIGSILVRFHGRSFSQSHALEAIVQVQTPSWYLMTYSRNLREHQGAYEILDTTLQAMKGFRIPGCDKLYPTGDSFVQEKDGVWVFESTFTASTLSVESLYTDPGAPLAGIVPDWLR